MYVVAPDLGGPQAAEAVAALTDDVRRVLGRAPRDFSDYAESAAAHGAWRG
ncbi:hypothetical protein GCM10022205_17880 [Spinactinospora alkalitolerans]